MVFRSSPPAPGRSPSALATPEPAFLDRRRILQGFGLGTGRPRRSACPALRAREDADPTADLYPAKKNDAYKLDRDHHARGDQRPLQQFLRVRDAARTSPTTRRT